MKIELTGYVYQCGTQEVGRNSIPSMSIEIPDEQLRAMTDNPIYKYFKITLEEIKK